MLAVGARERREPRKGAHGVSPNGVTANFMFFDSGTFWVLPLTCFHLPKSARANLFPHPVNIHYFCSGPTSVDPHLSATKPFLPGGRHARDAWMPRPRPSPTSKDLREV